MKLLEQLTNIESVNFALTNRVPRRALTLFFGWLSRVENPLLVRLALFFWRSFTDGLNLNEAKQRDCLSANPELSLWERLHQPERLQRPHSVTIEALI